MLGCPADSSSWSVSVRMWRRSSISAAGSLASRLSATWLSELWGWAVTFTCTMYDEITMQDYLHVQCTYMFARGCMVKGISAKTACWVLRIIIIMSKMITQIARKCTCIHVQCTCACLYTHVHVHVRTYIHNIIHVHVHRMYVYMYMFTVIPWVWYNLCTVLCFLYTCVPSL